MRLLAFAFTIVFVRTGPNILVALNSLYVVSIIINIIFPKADKFTEEEIEGKIELFKNLFKLINRLFVLTTMFFLLFSRYQNTGRHFSCLTKMAEELFRRKN